MHRVPVRRDSRPVRDEPPGYLTTATRAHPTGNPACATVMAGWDPDQTWWLTDILRVSGQPRESWVREDGRWRLALEGLNQR